MMLKEGGDLVLEAKGNTKLDEDLDESAVEDKYSTKNKDNKNE